MNIELMVLIILQAWWLFKNVLLIFIIHELNKRRKSQIVRI